MSFTEEVSFIRNDKIFPLFLSIFTKNEKNHKLVNFFVLFFVLFYRKLEKRQEFLSQQRTLAKELYDFASEESLVRFFFHGMLERMKK